MVQSTLVLKAGKLRAVLVCVLQHSLNTLSFQDTRNTGHTLIFFYLVGKEGVRRRANVLFGCVLARETGRERCDMPVAPQ